MFFSAGFHAFSWALSYASQDPPKLARLGMTTDVTYLTWNYMELHGTTWNIMEHHGTSWNIMSFSDIFQTRLENQQRNISMFVLVCLLWWSWSDNASPWTAMNRFRTQTLEPEHLIRCDDRISRITICYYGSRICYTWRQDLPWSSNVQGCPRTWERLKAPVGCRRRKQPWQRTGRGKWSDSPPARCKLPFSESTFCFENVLKCQTEIELSLSFFDD